MCTFNSKHNHCCFTRPNYTHFLTTQIKFFIWTVPGHYAQKKGEQPPVVTSQETLTTIWNFTNRVEMKEVIGKCDIKISEAYFCSFVWLCRLCLKRYLGSTMVWHTQDSGFENLQKWSSVKWCLKIQKPIFWLKKLVDISPLSKIQNLCIVLNQKIAHSIKSSCQPLSWVRSPSKTFFFHGGHSVLEPTIWRILFGWLGLLYHSLVKYEQFRTFTYNEFS